jgi:hypothetical protein
MFCTEILALYEACLQGQPDLVQPQDPVQGFCGLAMVMTFERDQQYWLRQVAGASANRVCLTTFPVDSDFIGKLKS